MNRGARSDKVALSLLACGLLFPLTGSVGHADQRLFLDAPLSWNFYFDHFNGMTGDFFFPEMTGQGGALFDYDGDGDLDVYLVQGGMLAAGKSPADALTPPRGDTPLSDRLLRNDLASGAGGAEPRFVDVTESAGLAAFGYGMGVATGDMDNDGFPDLYVTNYGANELWRNRGDGTFEQVTAERGVEDESWSTSAAFADLDADGWLDLYVVNYVDFDVVRNPACYATSTRRDYCGPSAFPPLADRFFHNLGDGRFEDVTTRRLASYRPGPGLGVAAADFNADGLLDLYVANDGAENQLWVARGDGTFSDESLFSGAAINRQGRAEASMGVAVGDFDNDGDEDLFLTHLMGETNTLYVNDGGALFEDRTLERGLSAPSSSFTAFGTGWIDYDNDGWLDLLALNGAVRILEAQAAAGEVYPLKQSNQLFRNVEGRFVETTAEAGPAFAASEVSRGAAFGDVDNDGDADVLVLNNNGPARLLINQVNSGDSGLPKWIGLIPLNVDSGGGPALGATATVTTAAGSTRRRRAATDGSYCSASDPRVIVGLGAERVANAAGSRSIETEKSAAVRSVRVRWRGGVKEWMAPPVGKLLVLPLE